MTPLLSIQQLSIQALGKTIVHQVSLDVRSGGILGIAGGSGSGKTTLGLAILQVLPMAMRITGGEIYFQGQPMPAAGMRQVRGKQIGMVFQDPLSAFDPLFTIGQHMDELLASHGGWTQAQRRDKIMRTLHMVEIEDGQRVYHSYPHQLSGGLRQRAMIAMAIACDPVLLIADEPTSSLDVSIQAKVMRLLKKINQEQGIAMILISHDLGVISHMADQIVVMNEGKIVERGQPKQILTKPQHAYTQELVKAFDL